MLNKWKKLDPQTLVETTLTNKAVDILEAQKTQMQRGLSSSDKPFVNANTGKSEYSPSYAKVKGKKSPIDLHKTGAFQNDLFIDIRTDIFVIDSLDPKTDKLLKQFGPDIFGLNFGTRVHIKPIIQKELVLLIKKDLSK